MKKPKTAIAVATVYVVIFQLLLQLNSDVGVIFSMVFFAPFLIVYMVYVVLKHGKPSEHTFDERFYDDWDYTRNTKQV